MRPRTLTVLAAVGFAVAAPVALAGQQSATIGNGAKTCVLGPGANCRGVVHRWTVEHHGNLRKAKFTKADLRGADFRGADLRGADFRGAKLRHAEMRGASLKGARFGAPPKPGKQANQTAWCAPRCQGADLSGASLANADLSYANLSSANLYFADLMDANLSYATLASANFTMAYLFGANLTGANLTSALFESTTCPNGTVTNTGC